MKIVISKTHRRVAPILKQIVTLCCVSMLMVACGGGQEDPTPAPANTPIPTNTPIPPTEAPEPAEPAEVETNEEAEEDAADESIRTPLALRTSLGCTACHNAAEPHDPENPWPTGPHQAIIHEYAADRVPGMSAEEYLYQSIVDPCAHLVEGYSACIMPQTYAEQMSEAEIRALVAWLLDPNRELE